MTSRIEYPISGKHRRGVSGTLVGWRRRLRIFCLILAATAIASQAQDEQPSTNSVKFTTLFNFDGSNGDGPLGTLVQGTDGNFYGTASGGAIGNGTVFKITPSGELTTLHQFDGTDGNQPGGLVLATDGNFYGTAAGGTSNACTFGCGAIFKITPGGALTTLHNFDGSDGAYPQTLIQATDGNFYGTTDEGGAVNFCFQGCGTVFRMSPSGAVTTLYNFCSENGCVDGSNPEGALVQGTDGNLYGPTFFGGASNACPTLGCGTVFKITPAGVLTTLVSFNLTNGASAAAGLVQGRDGNFYGTTEGGGADDICQTFVCGTVFKITQRGAVTTLHTFTYPGTSDGLQPSAALVLATDGSFYGTTAEGGANGDGTVFRITPDGSFTLLHSFDGTDGSSVFDGLFQGTDGSFYAPTFLGGANGDGTVFSLSVGLGPFVETVPTSGKVGTPLTILGTELTAATSVRLGGKEAAFTVVSASEITATVPPDARTGFVTVHTPSGTLKSNMKIRVTP